MAIESVTAKRGKDLDEVITTFDFDFGANLEEAVQLFGADAIYNIYKGGAVVKAQAAGANYRSGGKTLEEVQAFMNGWKPGVTVARVAKIADPVAQILAEWDSYPEERKAAIRAIAERKGKR